MRIEAGMLRQQDLSDRLTGSGYPTTRRIVAAWERDEYLPGLVHMAGLSVVLRVSQSYLLNGENVETGESEFIVRIRGLEHLLTERDKRMILGIVALHARENEETQLTEAQQQIVKELDDDD